MNAQFDKMSLGSVITSWTYKPPKSNKFLFAALGVIGALLVFTIFYGEQFLPWIKKIPSIFIYIAIFMLSPLLKLLGSMGRDQHWTLHEDGFSVLIMGKNNERQEQFGYWHDYKNCTYQKNVVKLVPAGPFKKGVRIITTANVMEVYSICRERISMAQAVRLEKSVIKPKPPKTREQEKLKRMEKSIITHQYKDVEKFSGQMEKKSRGFSMKNLEDFFKMDESDKQGG